MGLSVCLSVCVSVTLNLTSPTSVCLENDTTYLAGSEGQKFRGDLFKTAAFDREKLTLSWTTFRDPAHQLVMRMRIYVSTSRAAKFINMLLQI